MEKFYIVTNEKFLKEIENYNENGRKQGEFIKDFFSRNNITGDYYHLSGNGWCNRPFSEREKDKINLYVTDNAENDAVHGKQLLKAVMVDGMSMRKFRKNSHILKTFQDECVEKQICINNYLHREGDYFKELHMGGYNVTWFEYNGNYYLKISTSNYSSITPEYDGFTEIKGSEFYTTLEAWEEQA